MSRAKFRIQDVGGEVEIRLYAGNGSEIHLPARVLKRGNGERTVARIKKAIVEAVSEAELEPSGKRSK